MVGGSGVEALPDLALRYSAGWIGPVAFYCLPHSLIAPGQIGGVGGFRLIACQIVDWQRYFFGVGRDGIVT
jgi:hypothetical protein